MPSSLTVLDALPKTESGKLNRPGLPRPAVSTSGQTEPPRTDTERALATVFADLLSTSGRRAIRRLLRTRRRQHPVGPVGLAGKGGRSARQPAHGVREPDGAATGRRCGCAGARTAFADRPDDRASETSFEPMTTSGLSAADLGCGDAAVVEVARRNDHDSHRNRDSTRRHRARHRGRDGAQPSSRGPVFADGACRVRRFRREPADDPYVIGMAADISGSLDVALLRDCAAKMLIRHPNLRASFFSRGIAAAGADRAVASRRCRGGMSPPRQRTSRRWKPTSGDDRSTSSALPAIRFLLIELPDARLAVGDHRPPHRDRRLVAAGVRHRDDDPVPRRRRPRRAAGCAAAVPRLHRLARRPRSGSQPTGLA